MNEDLASLRELAANASPAISPTLAVQGDSERSRMSDNDVSYDSKSFSPGQKRRNSDGSESQMMIADNEEPMDMRSPPTDPLFIPRLEPVEDRGYVYTVGRHPDQHPGVPPLDVTSPKLASPTTPSALDPTDTTGIAKPTTVIGLSQAKLVADDPMLQTHWLTKVFVDPHVEDHYVLSRSSHPAYIIIVLVCISLAMFVGAFVFHLQLTAGGHITTVVLYLSASLELLLIAFVVAFTFRRQHFPRTFDNEAKLARRAEIIQLVAVLIIVPSMFLAPKGLYDCLTYNSHDPKTQKFCWHGVYPFTLFTQSLPLLAFRVRALFAAPLLAIIPLAYLIGGAVFGVRSGGHVLGLRALVLLSYTVVYMFLLVVVEKFHRRRFRLWVALKRSENVTKTHQQSVVRILQSILPGNGLALLSQNKPVIDTSEQCTMVVCQISDFSRWSASVLPYISVDIIDRCFSTFDSLLEAMEGPGAPRKVVVTGEQYIVAVNLRPEDAPLNAAIVSKVPEESMNPHRRVVQFALQQRRAVRQMIVHQSDIPFSVSIGVATGCCVGTIFGSNRLVYGVQGPVLTSALALVAACPASNVLADRLTIQKASPVRSKPFTGEVLGGIKASIVQAMAGQVLSNSSPESSQRPSPSLSPRDPNGPVSPLSESFSSTSASIYDFARFQHRRGAAIDIDARTAAQDRLVTLREAMARSETSRRCGSLAFTVKSIEGEFWTWAGSLASDVKGIIDMLLWFATVVSFLTVTVIEESWCAPSLILLAATVVLALLRQLTRVKQLRIPKLRVFGAVLQCICVCLSVVFTSPRSILSGSSNQYLAFALSFNVYWSCTGEVQWILGSSAVAAVMIMTFIIEVAGETGLTGQWVWNLMTLFVFAGALFRREIERRRTFKDTVFCDANTEMAVRELELHRSLLHMLLPSFVVEDVLSKNRRFKSNCVVQTLGDVVIMDLSLRTVQKLAPGAADLSLILGEAQRRFDFIENALLRSDPERSSEAAIIHVVGDAMRLAGPLRQPEPEKERNMEQSSVNLKRQFDQKTQVLSERAGLSSAITLLKVLSLVRAEFQTLVTAVIANGIGFSAVVGVLQPSFEIVGLATRASHALREAAPSGFTGATESFISFMQLGGFKFAGAGITLGKHQSWRVRGAGLLSVVPLHFAATTELQRENEAFNQSCETLALLGADSISKSSRSKPSSLTSSVSHSAAVGDGAPNPASAGLTTLHPPPLAPMLALGQMPEHGTENEMSQS